MTYSEVVAALAATGIPFAEDAWRNAGAMRTDYGVYAIDSAEDLVSDGVHTERFLEGTVDLFTRGSGAAEGALVETALNGAAASWRFSSRQYEQETGYTHREWIFRCLE